MSYFYEAMQEVLAGPKYDILTGRAIDYQQILMEALGRALISLLEQVRFNIPDTRDYNLEAITYIFVVVAFILLLGASAGVIYIILKRMGRRSKQKSAVTAIFEDIAHKRFTLPELLRLSRDCANKNQLRDAIRYCYIAVLVALDDKQTIKVDKSKTNAQLSQELALAAPTLTGPFISVVDVFQQTWFGFKAVDEIKYHKFSQDVEEILNEK